MNINIITIGKIKEDYWKNNDNDNDDDMDLDPTPTPENSNILEPSLS